MAKSKRKSGVPDIAGKKAKRKGNAAAEKENPFEVLHSKRKFATLGVRERGPKKNKKTRTRLRTDADEERKRTLLVEYRQLKKTNAFIDKRFGEFDQGLTEEEKAIARFQKQRVKEARRGRFALGDDDGDGGDGGLGDLTLTHGGIPVDDLDGDGLGVPAASDDEEGVDDEWVRRAHFGGGGADAAEDDDERPKSRKEVMEELIAKSKIRKAEKRREKDQDERLQDELDAQLGPLLAERLVAKRDKAAALKNALERLKSGAGAAAAAPARPPERKYELTEIDKAYDAATRELRETPGARALPSDRAPTQEEVAEAERKRAEAMERQRARRMRAVSGDDDPDLDAEEDDAALQAAGGYRARRERARRDAEEAAADEEERGGGGDGGGSDDFDGGEEDGSGDEGLAEVADAANAMGVGALQLRQMMRAQGDHPLQKQFRQVMAEVLMRHGREELMGDKQRGEFAELEGADSGGSDSEGGVEPAKPQRAAAALRGPLDVSFTPSAPSSYDELREMLHGRSPGDAADVVDRILRANRAELNADSRRGMSVFCALLVQFFVDACGGGVEGASVAEALVPAILHVTELVPVYAATLARARLERIHARVSDGSWPLPKQLLYLSLLATIFPVTDAKHAVLTPAALVVAQALATLDVSSTDDAVRGLYACGLLTRMHSGARRYPSEAVSFLARFFSGPLPRLLRLASASGHPHSSKAVPLSVLLAAAGPEHPAADEERDDAPEDAGDLALAAPLATAAFRQARRLAEVCATSPSAPEILAPLCAAIDALATDQGGRRKAGKSRASGVAEAAADTATAVREVMEKARASRRPVVQRFRETRAAKATYNPQFEDDFAKGKDYDPDVARAQARRAKKALAKETKGLMRDLRKDTAFMMAVKSRERATRDAERVAGQKRALSLLEAQQADLKSGGQGGTWKSKKKAAR
ncbi:unnamed protein product [Pedinophyceae sp. YPF-701]|nr:unnamed protein product [Pedinophyceae sp. YPF-701]